MDDPGLSGTVTVGYHLAPVDIVDRHFAAESAQGVKGTLATHTDDIVWDDVTHPACPWFDALAAMRQVEEFKSRQVSLNAR